MPSPKCPDCKHAETSHDSEEGLCRSCENRDETCPSFDPTGFGDPRSGSVPSDDGAEPDLYDPQRDIPEYGVEIGGHLLPDKSGPGMLVYRVPHATARTGAIIRKVAFDYENRMALENEAKFLEELEGSGLTPTLLSWHQVPTGGYVSIEQSDLGDSDEAPTDGEAFRRHMIDLLWTLRTHNVRHGDLTSANMILRDNVPLLIDFQESHYIGEEPPQKNPLSDTHLALRTLADWPTSEKSENALERGVADTPRVARRWRAVLDDLGATNSLTLPLRGKRFLDLGCYEGDFVALAACEGMRAWGVDAGGFRTGENCIEVARKGWGYMDMDVRQPTEVKELLVRPGVKFDQANIMDLDTFTHDVVLMFSTWSYLVRDYGLARATDKLQEIVQDCGTLYFENHLHGDGPAAEDWWPENLFRTEKEVEIFMREMVGATKVRKLATVPVVGRPASRTVWAVES